MTVLTERHGNMPWFGLYGGSANPAARSYHDLLFETQFEHPGMASCDLWCRMLLKVVQRRRAQARCEEVSAASQSLFDQKTPQAL